MTRRYVGMCDCGWTGPSRAGQPSAAEDLSEHRCVGGDEALAQVIRAAKMAAGRYLREHPAAFADPDSIVSDAYLGALAGWQSFDEGSGPLTSWCYGKAKWAILDGLRSRSRLSRQALAQPGTVPVWSKEPIPLDGVDADGTEFSLADGIADTSASAAFGHVDDVLQIQFAMAFLNERSAAIMRAYYWEGLSMAAIAARLGITESYVSQIHKRALRRMRSVLSEDPSEVGVARR